MKCRIGQALIVGAFGVALVLLACGKDAPIAPTANCTVALSPGSSSFGDVGGLGAVTVSTGVGCPWSATASGSWFSVTTGASGTGPGQVSYAVTANTSAQARAGTLTIGDQMHSVGQQGRPECTYQVASQTATFNAGGGLGTATVTAPALCAWTATTAESWLTITNGATGQGAGVVTYAISAHTGTAERTGVVGVAGVAVRVTQLGDTNACAYEVAPVTFTPCMAATTMTLSISTSPSCPWTASTGNGWLSVTGAQSGLGSGTISLAAASNYDAPRQGVVMVRWPTPTAGQNVQVAQAGCSYAVSQTAISVAAAGGAGSFAVYQQSDPYTCGGPLQNGCVWTASSDAPWITMTNPGNRQGDDTVRFSVSANSGTSARSGTIVVKGAVVTITQAGS